MGFFRTYALQISGVALATFVLVGIRMLPALTEPSGGDVPSTASFRAQVAREESYCEALGGEVDCACFGQKSAHVQEHDTGRAFGFFYANQQDLARSQAMGRC